MESETKEQLNLIAQIDDGFHLAERDMSMRGFGDMSKDACLQHGTALTPEDLQQIAQLEAPSQPLARAA